jgi:dynein heavy chain
MLCYAQEPTCAAFEGQLANYEMLQEKVSALPVSATFGWLKVDAKPAKQALSTWLTKWVFAYTQHLQDTIHDCLKGLSGFMGAVSAGLACDLDGLDLDQLTVAMTHIQSVHANDAAVSETIEPLRAMVVLLRKFGIVLPDATLEALDRLAHDWEDTKKLVFTARERVAPLLVTQADAVKLEAEAFGARIGGFRESFRAGAPFSFDEDDAYTKLDEWNGAISLLEAEAVALGGREALFIA